MGGAVMGQNGVLLRLRARRGLRLAVAVAGIAALSACTPLFRNHGYMPTESELAGLSVGVDTRESVIERVGAPTAEGLLTESAYYYVSSRFRHYGPLEPVEIDRQVLAISFDSQGRVRNIERFGLAEGRVVALSRRVTDDNIPDVSFIGQLIGNIGNFDPSLLIGED